MNIILKIVAIPFVIALSILGALFEFFFQLSDRIFMILSSFLGIGGVIMLLFKDKAGIGVLVIAFLVSPFGIPALAGLLAGLLDAINDSLKRYIVS